MARNDETISLLREFAAASGQEFREPNAVAWMTAHGWDAAAYPENAVRRAERFYEATAHRIPDIQREHGRQIASLHRQLEHAKAESRQNAEIAAAAVDQAEMPAVTRR